MSVSYHLGYTLHRATPTGGGSELGSCQEAIQETASTSTNKTRGSGPQVREPSGTAGYQMKGDRGASHLGQAMEFPRY